MSVEIDRLAYSMSEFAELTGLSLITVKRERRDGNLRTVKRRGRVIIPDWAAREYLNDDANEEAQSEQVAVSEATA